MEGRTLELKVGIFISIAFLLLFIIVFSIGDIALFEKGYRIKATFGFANGIAESAPVRLAGVHIGDIDKIDIFYDEEEQKTKVVLNAKITKKVKIEKDAQARINTLGLLGEKYLEITPGTRTVGFLDDGGVLIGEDPVYVEALTKDMKYLVDSASVIMQRLRDGEGTVGKLLVEEKVYQDLEAFVADIRAHPWKLLHKTREKKPDKKKDSKSKKRRGR